jgi:hypothetical protein
LAGFAVQGEVVERFEVFGWDYGLGLWLALGEFLGLGCESAVPGSTLFSEVPFSEAPGLRADWLCVVDCSVIGAGKLRC